jgi:protocatechuate 3,4-dioxygenase beta subunit
VSVKFSHTSGVQEVLKKTSGLLNTEGNPRLEHAIIRLLLNTVMFLHGRVFNQKDQPVAGATVDIWHANTKGRYSHFDLSQSAYNLRRRVITDREGRYRVRSILPSGYGCPADGPTPALLNEIGRHGGHPLRLSAAASRNSRARGDQPATARQTFR